MISIMLASLTVSCTYTCILCVFDNDGGIVQPTQLTEPKCKLNASTKSDLGRKGKTELRVLDQEDLIRNVLSILHVVLIGLLCQHTYVPMLDLLCLNFLPA